MEAPDPHLLYVGDNAVVMPALTETFGKKVDAVYIDPPYDHGDGGRRGSQRLFAYADRRAGDWGQFIRERLELALPLLSAHAPVAVSIGHRRVHELAQIMAEVFDRYEIVMITVDLRRAPADRLGVQRTADYVLIAVPPGVRLGAPGLTKGESRNGWNGFALSGFGEADYPNQVYPIFVNPDDGRIVGAGVSVKQATDGAPAKFFPAGSVAIMPITRDGKRAVWRNAREAFDDLHAAGMIRAQRPHMPGNVQPFTIQYVTGGTRKRIAAGEITTSGRDERGAIVMGTVEPSGKGVPAIWSGQGYETRAGTERLEQLIGPDHGFAYPKPVRLVADIIRACTGGRRDALVLDFFAGSATTLDAVAHLNAQDTGSRRAVLVQLDEGEIISRVTIPRAEAALSEWGGTLDVRRGINAVPSPHRQLAPEPAPHH